MEAPLHLTLMMSDGIIPSAAAAVPRLRGQGEGEHRHLVDRARRRPPHAAALPPHAAQDLEELQDEDLQHRAAGGQLHPDEEGPQDVPLPPQVGGWVGQS